MISKPISIGIAVVVFFAVVGISYAIFSNTYDPTTMKFRNQELFDQMMSNNPKMTAQWMENTMQDPQQMFEQMNTMMNKVSHFEIPYEDQERAQKFYEEVFGWQINKFSDEGYYLAFTTNSDPNTMMPLEPGAINGGLLKRDSTAKNPLLVIDVPNIDDHIKKIEDAGGELIMPKVSVGESGFFARVADTEGNVIAIWQQLKQ